MPWLYRLGYCQPGTIQPQNGSKTNGRFGNGNIVFRMNYDGFFGKRSFIHSSARVPFWLREDFRIKRLRSLGKRARAQFRVKVKELA